MSAVYVGRNGGGIISGGTLPNGTAQGPYVVAPGNYSPPGSANEGGGGRARRLLARIVPGSKRAAPFQPLPGNGGIASTQPVAGPYWPAGTAPGYAPGPDTLPWERYAQGGPPLGVPDPMILMAPALDGPSGLGHTPSHDTEESARALYYGPVPFRVPRPFKRAITLFAGPSQMGLQQQDYRRFLPPFQHVDIGYLRGARAVSGILGRQAASAGTARVPAVFVPKAVQ